VDNRNSLLLELVFFGIRSFIKNEATLAGLATKFPIGFWFWLLVIFKNGANGKQQQCRWSKKPT